MRRLAARLFVVALCSGAVSCTPIDGVRQTSGPSTATSVGVDASMAAAVERAIDDGSATPQSSVTSFEGMPCDREDARTCAPGSPSRQPFECSAGHWRPRGECSNDQRCEVAGGPDLGRCVAIVSECAGRSIGREFCNGKEIHVCTAAGTTESVRPCDADQMCTTTGGVVDCVCKFGFELREGACERSTTCDPAAMACDPLSTCTLKDNKPTCGSCPADFAQTADSGCVPLLSQLVVDSVGATLTPAFAPDVTSYRVRLPMVAASLELSLKGPSQAQIQVNETPLDASGHWTSPVLPLGEHPIQITLTSSSNTTNKYELVVEHAGKQDAYVKARTPEPDDCFGFMVAMS